MPAPDPETVTLQLPRDRGLRDVVRVLHDRFATGSTETQRRRVTYYDTFDARLHRAGLLLGRGAEGSNGSLRLASLGGRPIARCDAHGEPGFPTDLPEGPLRDAVARRAGIRRLLAQVEIEKTISAVRILDAEGKTVVHLHLERGRAGEPGAEADRHAVPAVIRVVPVKGYDGALARVVGMLTDKMDAQRLADDELALAMHAAGRRLDDPSKVDTRLDPACPAGTAMRTLHAALLEIVVRNEPGTRTQVDTEFLHDFRVTVRRIRSALGQVKGVFPEADRARFAAEFKWLGDATGPARDADVFLLKLPAYRAQLPEHSRNDLEPLAGFLERRREAAYRELVAALDSKRYARLVEDWRAYLASPAVPDETAPLADRPIREVASARIRSVAKGVLKKGTAIDDDTPAEALHRLRIRCKKLRYLLDLFRSLYDADEIARLVRALKKLQDNLGDFNDCEVQQDWLTESAREMTAEGTAPVETLLAMGRLEDRLDLGQRKERQRFGRRFAAFATRDTRDRLRRLFAPEGGPRP